jgi:hypothetical protein
MNSNFTSLKIFLFTSIFLIFTFSTAYSQMSSYISSVKALDVQENEEAEITLNFFQTQGLNKVLLAYRTFGESEYKEMEVMVSGTNGKVNISAENVTPPFIEYYFVLQKNTGQSETYPLGFPYESSPLQLRVNSASPKDKEVILMSPERNSQIAASDFFVSISLLRASDEIDKAATKIFIDNTDITNLALFADDLIIFSAENFPKSVSLGTHLLRIEVYDKSNQLYHTISSKFTILTSEQAVAMGDRVNYRVNVTGESRNENIKSNSNWFNNINVDATADYKSWEARANIYVTSEEKKYLQPFNRYSLNVRNGWLSVDVGDNYPVYPSNILSGRRVRGVNGSLNLGFFNLQVTLGETERDIEGQLLQVLSDTSTSHSFNTIQIDSTKYRDADGIPASRGIVNIGTYKRNIFAVRPSFGKGENFQWGFTYLHSQDDPKSIEFGVKPQENLVLGTDLLVAFDDQKVMFTAQGAFSLLNKDIATGELKDELIDSLAVAIGTSASTFRTIRDVLGTFITVNQFLIPLNPQELPTVAAEAAMAVNYFGNFFKVSYQYRGNDYVSFGQNFLRTDIAGISLTDRLRLFQNKLFLSLTYENLNDNIQETKLNTTNYQNLSSSVSYYPRVDLPSFTLSYANYSTKNDAPEKINDTLNIMYLNSITGRLGFQVAYDFFFKYRHQASISINYTSGDDKTFRDYDITNLSLYLVTNTTWTDRLQSNLNISINQSEVVKTTFNYTTLGIGARYVLLKDKLNLNGSYNPSFGDLKRNLLEISSQYFVMKNLNLQLNVRWINYAGGFNDTFFGLTTNYSFY